MSKSTSKKSTQQEAFEKKLATELKDWEATHRMLEGIAITIDIAEEVAMRADVLSMSDRAKVDMINKLGTLVWTEILSRATVAAEEQN